MDVVTLALAKKGAKEYTDQAISMLPNGLVYKGGVDNYAALPSSGQKIGDCYTTKDTGSEYAWGTYDGTNQWIEIGINLDSAAVRFDKSQTLTDAQKLQARKNVGAADVQINGTSITTNGVANIPKADGSTLGVFKTSSGTATYITGAGALAASEKTYADYGTAGTGCFIGKGTLENVLTNEAVRPDAAQSLTTAQQAQARTNINAITMEEYDSTATPEDNVLYYVIED